MCTHFLNVKHLWTCIFVKYPTIYINIQGYSKHSSYHTYIFFWKEYIYTCSKYCVKITHVHILSILLQQTTYAHLEYFINIYILLFHIFLYMHIGEPNSCHAHTCIFWEGTFMSFIYTWKAIPHHTFIWEEFPCHFWHGYIFWKAPYANYPQIYIFWKAFLLYLSYIYRFLKCIICYTFTLCKVFLCHIFTHFATYFYAIYIHIYTYRWKVFSMLPRCKVFLMGQPNLNSNKNLSNMS